MRRVFTYRDLSAGGDRARRPAILARRAGARSRGQDMKRHLNTLFVLTQGAYLSKENETAVVRVEDATKIKLPILSLQGVVCFGQVSMSPQLMSFCCERGVGVSFLSEH